MPCVCTIQVSPAGVVFVVNPDSNSVARLTFNAMQVGTLEAEDDVLDCARFDDSIGVNGWPVERHIAGDVEFVFQKKPVGVNQLPYRMIVPLGIDNLLVAGRCISGTHEAHSSYRVMPIVMATGHAAGVCAALSVQRRIPPRELPARQVQDELLRQGASLRHSVREGKNRSQNSDKPLRPG